MKLIKYREKRNFNKTKEPIGKLKKNNKENIFVVQHHLARRDHYDFRLEYQGVLLSWAVPKGPSFNHLDKRLAVRVEDHPYDYKDFEGVIPEKQYGAGPVMVWDEGTWQSDNIATWLKQGILKFKLNGQRLKGKWMLLKTDDKNWLLIKEKDQYAKKSPGIAKFVTSVKTGRTMKEIIAGKKGSQAKLPFAKVEVKLAQLGKMPASDEWLYEIKYDGYRMISFIEAGNVKIVSRNNRQYQNDFPAIVDSLITLAKGNNYVFDGEIVVYDQIKKRTNFQALQNYFRDHDDTNLFYVIFDLLAEGDQDFRDKPLILRKKRLKQLLKKAPNNIVYSHHVSAGEKSFALACQLGFEGIIAKRKDSNYSGGRSGDWLKLKCSNQQELVIGGYSVSNKENNGLSALLLGYFVDKQLIYAGKVGTGFTAIKKKELLKKFKKLIRKTSPFIDKIKLNTQEKTVWLKPSLIAEIKFSEWTKDNHIRHGSFQGLREDKAAKDIKQEKNTEVVITNKDKLMFANPKIKKGDVANYYRLVSPKMLPFLNKRLLSLINCPQGTRQPCFFKKHPLKADGIIEVKDKDKTYFYIKDDHGIINQVQQNTIEFHIWGSHADKLDKPDMMVFDLDPDDGLSLVKVRQGVKDIKKILDQLKLKCFLKTSGGKGYHVVVPFKANASWKSFTNFAKDVALLMEKRWPQRYTSNVRKEKRKGKIFIDWMRNSRGATSIAPYSIRARPGAKVSMPISFDELNKIKPDGIGIKQTLQKIKQKDPWQTYFQVQQKQILQNYI